MNLNLKFRLIRDIVCIPLHLLSVLGILITLGCKRHPFDTLQLKWIGYIMRRWIRHLKEEEFLNVSGN
jgi:hypothetical protein